MVLSHRAVPALAITAIVAALLASQLSACAVGPDYVRPSLDVPSAYKEAEASGSSSWKPAEPQSAGSAQPWWAAYGDPTLSALIDQAGRANQTLQQAEAQYRQAKAVADAARAGLFPTVGASAGAQRARTDSAGSKLGNVDSVGLSASWEPDLWGSVRRSIESGDAGTQASADDLAAARLSIQAALAQDYLQLRITDQLRALYAATTAAYLRSSQLTQSQYKAGVALRSDVALAESQLKTAQAQGVDLEAQRAQLEHAIAVLTGQAPASLAIAPLVGPASAQAPAPAGDAASRGLLSQSTPPQATSSQATAPQIALPAIPAGVPSELLERRPDIAAAERRVAAANANIGVAKAAFFPSLVLSASGGFGAASFGSLFDTPSRVWSLGAALAGTIFDGGLRRAHTDQAIAAYDSAVAQYKQTVLVGFQQVEDNLATLRVLAQEATLQDQAVQASQLAERLALSQYRAGTASYLSVVTAQTLSLTNRRTAVQVQGRRLAASVGLVTATGGGWNSAANAATDNAATGTTADTAPAIPPQPIATRAAQKTSS
ncbi:efflux transporter outer membrane subunit [soil metagenome]